MGFNDYVVHLMRIAAESLEIGHWSVNNLFSTCNRLRFYFFLGVKMISMISKANVQLSIFVTLVVG